MGWWARLFNCLHNIVAVLISNARFSAYNAAKHCHTRNSHSPYDSVGLYFPAGNIAGRYVRQLAETSRCPLPVADTVFNSLLSAAANGYGRKDVGAILTMMQRAAGVPQEGGKQTAQEGGTSQQA